MTTSIDIHAHWYPEAWVRLLETEGPANGAEIGRNPRGNVTFAVPKYKATFQQTYIDLPSRLREMDAARVDVHALSLTQPMVYWADDELGLQLSVAVNDAISAAHVAHPDRFIGFAHLPFQNPSLALEELERAAKLPGIRGIYMATAVRDRELSDRSFFPVYERMADLGLPLFLHPMMINNERLKQRRALQSKRAQKKTNSKRKRHGKEKCLFLYPHFIFCFLLLLY